MSRRMAKPLLKTLLAVGLSLLVGNASAQNLLIRNATMHSAGAQRTLQHTDVLVKGGNIAAIGRGLSANGAEVIDAGGKPLTPTMFGGVTGIGLEEVSLEDSTTEQSLALGAQSKQMVVRPGFDAALAYLTSCGWSIEAHRFKLGRHDLDLVVRRGPVVAFVEDFWVPKLAALKQEVEKKR